MRKIFMRVTDQREKEGKEKDRDKYVKRGREEIEEYIYYLKSGI